MLSFDCTFSGRTPLVVHNIRLANPLDPYTKAIKAISSKRQKTEDDHLEMMRLEWEGGLYIDDQHGPYLPVTYPTAALREAAAITRHKTTLKRALMISGLDGGDRLPIEYEGPRTIDEMWVDDDYRVVSMVRVNSSRTLRTRPRFPEWAINFRVVIDESLLDVDVLEAILRRAGHNIGIGEAPDGLRARFEGSMVAVADEIAVAA